MLAGGRALDAQAVRQALKLRSTWFSITMDKEARVARVNDRLCIRCYCCHEVCPYAAIDLEHVGLGRILHRFKLV